MQYAYLYIHIAQFKPYAALRFIDVGGGPHRTMSAASASAPRRKRRARGALPPQPDIAVFDARPTKSLARLLGYERCAVYSVVSNGDCLYRAVYASHPCRYPAA